MSRVNNKQTISTMSPEDELIKILSNEADEMLLHEPAVDSWNEIKATLDAQENATRNIRKKSRWGELRNIAAVITIGISCWVGWSNYQLQNQFTQLLVQNQILELQLMKSTNATYSESSLLFDVEVIERELIKASSKKERLDLLEKRRKSIEKILEIQNGKAKEFYL